ncbi:MAG: ABC transporter ATP-binding protein [Campylobacter sp.]|nr:ABC transporter ATP-binding protein [Campylobacter sp.]
MKNLVEINSGEFWYERGKILFSGLNFTVKKGEILAILGLNGQGKSTLLNCLMKILPLRAGSVSLNSTFSYLPQNFALNFDFNVLDIVIMGRVREISLFSKPSPNDAKIALEALESLGIANLAQQSFNSLSGGQKQLVLFARCIASKSEILFLDEPLSALDLKNQDKVLTLIFELKKRFDLSVIFTTHQPSHALAISDKTLILQSDLSYSFGESNEILSEQNLTKLYEIEIKRLNFAKFSAITQIFSAQKQ